MHNIVDCFIYFNEKELLELRVNLLKDYVDKFIIVDGNYTFSGIPKEFTCKKVIKELQLPEDIIEVIEVDLSLENLDPASDYEKQWVPDAKHASREKTQRDAISRCLKTNNFDQDTVFIIGDCDEIINPKYIQMMCNFARQKRDKIFKVDLVQLEGRSDFRVYNKNTNKPFEWRYSLFFCLKEHIKTIGINDIRNDYNNPYPIVWPYTSPRDENGIRISGERMQDLGWHFTWMGNNNNRKIKSQSFSHHKQEFDFIIHKSYETDEMKKFIDKYEFFDGNIPPSGDINCIIKKYPIENLPQIIFQLPRVKEFLLPSYSDLKNSTSLKNFFDYILP